MDWMNNITIKDIKLAVKEIKSLPGYEVDFERLLYCIVLAIRKEVDIYVSNMILNGDRTEKGACPMREWTSKKTNSQGRYKDFMEYEPTDRSPFLEHSLLGWGFSGFFRKCS